MISNALNLILMIVLIIFNMVNIGVWPMVILALLIVANSIFMVYKTVDAKNAMSNLTLNLCEIAFIYHNNIMTFQAHYLMFQTLLQRYSYSHFLPNVVVLLLRHYCKNQLQFQDAYFLIFCANGLRLRVELFNIISRLTFVKLLNTSACRDETNKCLKIFYYYQCNK